jgi:hypothetical protein
MKLFRSILLLLALIYAAPVLAETLPSASAPLDYNQWKADKDLSQCPEVDSSYSSPQIQQQFKISQQLCSQADAEERKLATLGTKIAARLVQEGLFAKGALAIKPVVEKKEYDPTAGARAARSLQPLKPQIQSILYEEAQAYFPSDKWKLIKLLTNNPPDYIVYATPLQKSDEQPFSYKLGFEPSAAEGINIILQSAMDQDSELAQAVKFAGWHGGIKATVEVTFREDAPVQVSSSRRDWRCFPTYDQFFVRDANDLYKACQAKINQP